MKHSGFQTRFLVIVCVCYATLVDAEMRSKRFSQNSAILKALTLENDLHHHQQQQQQHNNYINSGTPFVSRYDPTSPDTPSDTEDPDEILAETVIPPSPWYSAIHSSVRYPLTHFYMGRQDEEKGKRFFDSLGGSEVHGFKRSAFGRLGSSPERFRENSDIIQMVPDTYDGALVDASRSWQGIDSVEKAEDANQQPLFEVHYLKPLIHKRALDSLGGFQVHGWKREAGKRSLSSLGGFQVHGWKRRQNEVAKKSLDSLGGFQVHGWKKRAVDAVDKLHMSKIESTASRITKSGGILSGVAEGKMAKLQESVDIDQSNGASGAVGKLVENKLVDGSTFGVNDSNLDRNSDYQYFGKRALDSLGDFQVHGWKRDEGKRALDSLGDFQVHGWKRDARAI
uniref:Feeding circuit activating peptide 1 n=1 Tax=Deroceras reticulatum TaxID=145610 RepID=A0A1X9WEC9_DERRE|nr:feeding circuit activating peptide 1 [Deroceras reticulatum]